MGNLESAAEQPTSPGFPIALTATAQVKMLRSGTLELNKVSLPNPKGGASTDCVSAAKKNHCHRWSAAAPVLRPDHSLIL